MNLIFARRLLVQSARLYESKSKALSKVEITNKINEIKYLAEHKKASKQSIKHEIESLENKLEGVFELQKNVANERKKQTQKETLLKKRIAQLEHQLEIGKDKAIHKKVERLSNILAEHIVHKKVAQEITHIRAASKINTEHPSKKTFPNTQRHINTQDHSKSALLLNQVHKLKAQLELKKSSLDPISIQIIEEKIHLLEIKLGLHIKPHTNQNANQIPKANITITNRDNSPTQQSENQQITQSEEPMESNQFSPNTQPFTTQKTTPNLPPPQKTEIKHTVLLHTPPPPSPHHDLPSSLQERILNKSSPLPPPPKRII